MSEVLAFLYEVEGASAAVDALILAIVGGGIAVAAMALGGAIGTSVNNTTECIETKVC